MAATIYTPTTTNTPALDLATTAATVADRIRIAARTKNALRTFIAYPLLAVAGLGLGLGALAENTATTAQLGTTTPAITQTATATPAPLDTLTLVSATPTTD